MKKLIISLSILALTSCQKEIQTSPRIDMAALDKSTTSEFRRCWTCEIMYESWPCTTIEIDTVCGKTEPEIRAYEASMLISTDTIRQTVSCH